MSLLPERHPNLDFFVLDITDAVPKDDLASRGQLRIGAESCVKGFSALIG